MDEETKQQNQNISKDELVKANENLSSYLNPSISESFKLPVLKKEEVL